MTRSAGCHLHRRENSFPKKFVRKEIFKLVHQIKEFFESEQVLVLVLNSRLILFFERDFFELIRSVFLLQV